MSWFRHHYHCAGCQGSWLAEADLVVEADCPYCGAHDVFAYKSDDRSVVVEEHKQLFVVLEAMKSAERRDEYRKLKSFRTRAQADAFRNERRRAG